MPTVEMDLSTRPMPRVDEKCAYCDISLAAIPDPAMPYLPPGAPASQMRHAHAGNCISILRRRDAGIL